MGMCFSSESAGDAEQKKRSQAIDRKLEEDSRRLRRECKILLLGRPSIARVLRVSCRVLDVTDFLPQDPARAASPQSSSR